LRWLCGVESGGCLLARSAVSVCTSFRFYFAADVCRAADSGSDRRFYDSNCPADDSVIDGAEYCRA